jgi:hypothetical protein
MNGATAKLIRKSTRKLPDVVCTPVRRRVKRMLRSTPAPERAGLKRLLKPDEFPAALLARPAKKKADAHNADKKPCPTRRREQMRKHLDWIAKRFKAVPVEEQNTKDGKVEVAA